MTDFSWLTALIVFVVYVFFDVLYALYVICVSRRQAISASAISSVLYSLGAYGTMNYLHNPLYLIPLAAGAFLGTYIAVRYMGDWHK
ncbi:hypothetical protein EBZ39_01920 [bacterium]|nr:hypothetical protein [bacterium]